MAYVKSKKMRSKKKARKSRKMKRIRGGGEKGEGGGAADPVPNAAVRSNEAANNGAVQEPASVQESAVRSHEAANNGAVQEPANETSIQKAIKMLNILKPKVPTELVAEFDKIITVLESPL